MPARRDEGDRFAEGEGADREERDRDQDVGGHDGGRDLPAGAIGEQEAELDGDDRDPDHERPPAGEGDLRRAAPRRDRSSRRRTSVATAEVVNSTTSGESGWIPAGIPLRPTW